MDVLPGGAVSQGVGAGDCALTPDRVADMGDGAVFFSGRVRIEKCAG
ncbi:hypothetical protein B2K_38445 [Paenibacillus mucilaginosus K02]|uniref:Uncharacterized protein n=1 Tax=Paenibacillus mucilaginosus K02 TaxID=997761 RepID=R9UMU3_9BACL|nr:hypothetical protein B2K_38445 [Paenibacillus mucilaginosus K02]